MISTMTGDSVYFLLFLLLFCISRGGGRNTCQTLSSFLVNTCPRRRTAWQVPRPCDVRVLPLRPCNAFVARLLSSRCIGVNTRIKKNLQQQNFSVCGCMHHALSSDAGPAHEH